MLHRLEKFFKEQLQTVSGIPSDEKETKIQIATAVLFLEMAFADFEIDPQEELEITNALQTLFKLEAGQVEYLLKEAKTRRSEAHDIYRFTNLLKEHYTRNERLRILEMLWLLIFADGRVDKYEDALIRKITTLLGLEHGDMIQAKLAMRTRSEQSNKI
jgi:uncharacterized tellurite resistance protein B-like protein